MKNYSSITENKDIITKEYADSNFMPFSGGTFTGDVTFSSGQGHLRTDLIRSADDSKWIAEFTSSGLELGGSGYALRFYSSTRPVVANLGKELAYTSDIPAAVTESTVSVWGFTKNTGTVTSVAVKMNGATKGTVTSSGTIDLGTVITSHQDISGLMPKSGGTFTGVVTFDKQINLGQGDANCLYLGADGRLNGPENRTLLGLVGGETTCGHTAYTLALRGSGIRPKFNGNEIALKSDIPTIPDTSNLVPKSAFSLSGTILTITI